MVDFKSSLTNTDGANYPDTLTVNATGAGTGDGTELVKILMDQFVGGFYALMDAAGLTPDSVTEAPDTSQILDSVRKISGSPGEGVIWWKNSDPAVSGDRVLLLSGQVITIASYPELAAAIYTGDGTNGTASAFYKTSDVGGTTRNIAGTYMVLADTRGYALRGLDAAASVDPDGASRDFGSIQGHAFMGHYHRMYAQVYDRGGGGTLAGINQTAGNNISQTGGDAVRQPITDGVNGTPIYGSETRMINVATTFGIRY